ncbi:MAG TPA: hypothetical protein VLO11_00895 [Luteolibacter sp.]|nr:hypothetical protein [Luteolibacter sp.]
MKKYTIELNGTSFEKTWFVIVFTIACFSIIFLPFAVVFLITNLEIRETSY